MEAKSSLIQSLLLAVLLFVSTTAPALPPSWKFKVLRSPHFELVYREEQKLLAKRYILAAEQAHELLFPIFKEGPSKTILFLQDDTDSSNGEANFLPYPHIVVYPVLPTVLDSNDDYGDWPLEMMVHEYTHILNMYPAHGIYAPLKYIFGSVLRPNAVLPKWYLEGLAVNMESVLTDHGRLRSSETMAGARALTLEDRLDKEDVARMNQQELGSWPYGARPYMFGGWWWETVAADKGAEVIERWNQNFSRRLPYLLNGPMLEATGKDSSEWMQASNTRLKTQAQNQLASIRAAGVTTAQPVGEESGEQSVFALSPNGMRLIFWSGTFDQGNQVKVKVRTLPGQEFKAIPALMLFKTVGTVQVRWLDDDRVVFDQIDIQTPYVNYRDLYVYDFRSNQITRLTTGLRAQEAAASPDGESIAYIQNDGGRNRLATLNLKTGATDILVNGNFAQRLSGPEYFTRDQIVFSVRQKNGVESLHVYDLSTRKASMFNEQLKATQGLRRTSRGFFVTDATQNVRNAYWIHDGITEAVSNTLTDIQQVDYDPQRQEVLISELTASGRKLRSVPLKAQTPPLLASSSLPAPPKAKTESVPLKEESYQPLSYMWPRYWIPFAYQVEGGFIFQGLTGNEDPAGRNSYNLLGSYDTVTKRGSYGGTFVNNSLPTEIGAGYYKSESYLGASGLTLESQSASLNFSNRWPFNNRREKWDIGGLWLETSNSVTSYRRLGPTFSYVYSNLKNPLNSWYGVHAELAHQQFLPHDGFLEYGRSYVHVAQRASLGRGHNLRLDTRAMLAPRLPLRKVLTLGDPSLGGNYAVNLTNSSFLLRGYPTGEFVGRKILNANLEYGLPIFPIERGYGTFPLFLSNTELVFFVDTMAVDGAAYDTEFKGYIARKLGDFATGAGSELRLNTIASYHLPLSFTFGLYYGVDSRFGGGLTTFFAFGMGALSGLQDKTP